MKGAAAQEWRENCLLPVVSALGYFAGISYLYSLGLFIAPLEQEFGWSRATITSGLSIVSIVYVGLVPLLGWLIDRHGARRFAVPGMLFYSLALAALGLANSSPWSWWLLWTLLAIGAACVQGAVWTAAVAARFDSSRGLAIAITFCGAGIGSATIPLGAEALIAEFGWRNAYVIMGASFAAVVFPLLFLFFERGPATRLAAAKSRPARTGFGIREALVSSRFVRISLASFLIVTAITGLLIHFVPILTALGMERGDAASAAAMIGLGSIAGRLGCGLLLDRFPGALIGAVSFSLPIVVCVLLLQSEAAAIAPLVAFVLGLSLGSELDVMAYLTSRYFGLRNFGMLFSILVGIQTMALGVGPLIAGYIYDSRGSYHPMLWGMMPLFVVSAAMIASLGRYPSWGGHQSSSAT